MGVLLPVLVGTLGLGFEVSNWYRTNRSMQNAADAAAIAAATNGSSNYDVEALAVAAQYGFVNGAKNVTVAASNTAACPTGVTGPCYSVTVSSLVPLDLLEVVGFKGSASLNGGRAQSVSATAVANQTSTPISLCLLALGKSGAQDIVTNGNPNANMTGCSVMANTSATCNGSNLKADWGLAHGTDNGCGVNEASGVPQVSDPYQSYKNNIPTNPCQSSDYTSRTISSWPPTGKGVYQSGSQYVVCGDIQLSGSVTVPSGTTLVMEGGGGYFEELRHRRPQHQQWLYSLNSTAMTLVFSGRRPGRRPGAR